MKKYYYLFIIIVAVGGLVLSYGYCNYFYFDSHISGIEITFNKDISKKGIPIMYVSKSKQEKLDYAKVYRFKKRNDSVYVASFEDFMILRKFRLYFEYPNEHITMSNIKLITNSENISLAISELDNYQHLKRINNGNKLDLEIYKSKAFIETPKSFSYSSDIESIYLFLIPIIFLIGLIVLVFNALKKQTFFKVSNIKVLSVIILLSTIFLPAPIYNIALILTALINIKSFNLKDLLSNKINIIIIAFFVIYLLNNLFVSHEGYKSMGTIERFLPFLILPIALYTSQFRKLLFIFVIVAFIIGFGLILTSIYDVYIHKNLVFLSFEFFTKYLHPVYFSYLLFLSICYIDLNYTGKKKYFLEFILFVFLIFSGSKMVFIFSIMVIFFNLIKNKKTLLIIAPLTAIVVLFSPLKHRFNDILSQEDLSILNEEYIENNNDPRVNGLTLRLMLWREVIATMNGVDYIIGKGVTKTTNKLLQTRLANIGMINHTNFNPHNQYIDTFWRTGIIGLLFLILIPVYSLILGIRNKDKLLIQFSLFMIVVMLTESIFGRVTGIYFFTTVLLLLMNTTKINEDSYNRN